MGKKEEIEARRAARAAKLSSARDDQEVADLEAIDALEFERGETFLTLTVNKYVAGQPVKVAYKAPSSSEYRRYCDMLARATQKNDVLARKAAQELLAESCWVYPSDKERRDSFKETHPGVLLSIAVECAKAAELRAEDEGKG